MSILLRILGTILGVGAGAALVGWSLRPASASKRGSPREGTDTAPKAPPTPIERPTPAPASVAPVVPRATSAQMTTHVSVDEHDPHVVQWQPAVFAQAALAGVPPAFAMAWLAVESGGNPCAVGEATATGPDGYPREVGLFQMYNPDDFKEAGASASEICSYCVRPPAGPKTKRAKDGGYADGSAVNHGRMAVAQLTPEQVVKHVGLGISMIKAKERYADQYLRASHVPWAADSPDYWAAVKAVHAYPAIVASGISAVTRKLGRAPSSWHEFRSTYEAIEPRARFDPARPLEHPPRDQDPIYRGLENAEWTGFHVQAPEGPAVS